MYAPLGVEALGEKASRRIAEAIGLGLLDVGDRLPAEGELAERFGISPMTLREALAHLRDAGYLETRRGRGGGTFVRAVNPQLPARSTRSQHLAELSLGDLRDITDYREALEGGGAALAEHRGRMKERSVMLAAVEAVTDADPVRESRRHTSGRRRTGNRR